MIQGIGKCNGGKDPALRMHHTDQAFKADHSVAGRNLFAGCRPVVSRHHRLVVHDQPLLFECLLCHRNLLHKFFLLSIHGFVTDSVLVTTAPLYLAA